MDGARSCIVGQSCTSDRVLDTRQTSYIYPQGFNSDSEAERLDEEGDDEMDDGGPLSDEGEGHEVRESWSLC